ncbi:MAG: alpha/beta hydrolase [Bdellovibrio sp.]|nr:alpha/beta hydrolase [Bdellovibrio sp.]
MNVFFIHGGPGFNSEPDRVALQGALRQQGISGTFWDEPSRLRPQGTAFLQDNAYSLWLEDLHRALTQAGPSLVVASSFGAKGLLDLLHLYPDTEVAQILMIAPTLNMGAVFKRMMHISEKDLSSSAPATAQRLRECREGSKSFWDPLMQEGLGLVWQNPNLLTHYFTDDKALRLWVGVGADPRFGIDMESQIAVLADLARLRLPALAHPLDKPVLVLTGSSDPVFNQDEVSSELKSIFSNVAFENWSGCGHMPQLERPVDFVHLLKRLLPN